LRGGCDARDDAIILRDIVGKLDVLNIESDMWSDGCTTAAFKTVLPTRIRAGAARPDQFPRT